MSAGTWYEIDLKGTGANPAGENRLEIYDSNGNRLAYDTTAGWGWDSSRLLFKAPADGTYYIGASEVRSNIDRNVHPDGGDYRLSLAVAQPAGYDEIAAFLTDGYWRAGGRRAFDLDSDRTLDVDITGLAANGQQLARWAFEGWSNATGIRFRFVDRDADIVLDDELGWSHADTVVSGGKVVSGTVNITKFSGAPAVNDPNFETYLHEIGHVLGLGHAGRYNGYTEFPDGIEFPNETLQATVMSYFNASGNPRNPAVNTFVGGAWHFPVTPMIADILAVRDLYGPPAAVRAGDTVYGWQGNVGGYLGHLLTELTGGTPDVDVHRGLGRSALQRQPGCTDALRHRRHGHARPAHRQTRPAHRSTSRGRVDGLRRERQDLHRTGDGDRERRCRLGQRPGHRQRRRQPA